MKLEIVGVKPGVERSAEDLDPPTIFHINQDYNMIMYFVRTILQFQFAEKLCEVPAKLNFIFTKPDSDFWS